MALSTGASCDVGEVKGALHEVEGTGECSAQVDDGRGRRRGGEEDEEGENTKKIPFIFQLYVHSDRSLTSALLHRVVNLGIDAIFVTVDAPVPGKREADERLLISAKTGNHSASSSDGTRYHAPMTGMTAANDSKGGALGRVMGTFIDASLTWSDIPFIRSHLPQRVKLYIKGIQTAADARCAASLNHSPNMAVAAAGARAPLVDGIVLSNHGARSVDTSPPSLLVLLELHKSFPEVFDQLDVFVDGGVMRGTDVFKALCLGASAVGIGRPVMCGLGWGRDGVRKVFDSKFLFTSTLTSCLPTG